MKVQRCPGCQEACAAGDFIAGLCDACFASGKPIPPGPLEQLTTRTLVRIGRGYRNDAHRAETPRNALERPETACNTVEDAGEEEAMETEMVRCDVCGMEVKRQGLGVHKARKHKQGRGSAPALTARASHREQTDGGRPGQSPETTMSATPDAGGNGCGHCPFRGLESHVARVLVAQAVQAGMGLEPAAQFVRQAQAAFGS